jgi:hypothetical protein
VVYATPLKRTPVTLDPSDFLARLKAAVNFQTRSARTVTESTLCSAYLIHFSASFQVLSKCQWVNYERFFSKVIKFGANRLSYIFLNI